MGGAANPAKSANKAKTPSVLPYGEHCRRKKDA